MAENAPVLVIGAGPAGLAAGACLKREGVPFRLVDRRGLTGGAYNHIYPGITLASPTRYAGLPGLQLRTRGEYVTVPEYRAYLERYAVHHQLHAERAEVRFIERQGHDFLVRFADAAPAVHRAVVVATGMYDHLVRPDIPGLPADAPEAPGRPAVVHAHDWPGPASFRGRRLLVIGGGTSAVEIAEECGRAGLPVVVSSRSKLWFTPQRILGRDIHDWAYLFLERVPRWLLGSGRGWVTAEYGMLPASTGERKQRDVTKGRPDGRTVEIQRLIGRSLRGVVDFSALGERTIYVDCDVLQADGGTRCASITGGLVALRLACERLRSDGALERSPLTGTVAAVSCGIVGGIPLLDLDYSEDSSAEVDANVVMTGDGGLVEVQATAERTPLSRAHLDDLLALAGRGIEALRAAQDEVVAAATA